MSTATLLPNGQQQFIDLNGSPYANGKVYFYVPGTFVLKTTWVDPNQIAANLNPVILDAAGRATIFGAGQYRQILFDENNIQIWDELVEAPLGSTAISTAFAPVAAALTLTTARTLLGVDAEIAASIENVALLAGPTGPMGNQGNAGPTGPQGSASGSGVNIQTFTNSGTWIKPDIGTFACIQIWGAGGAGSPVFNGGGGGPGGYIAIWTLLSQLSTCAVTLGIGGIGSLSETTTTGNSGTNTLFGSFLTMSGGTGGTLDENGSSLAGTSGTFVSATGFTPIFLSYDYGISVPVPFSGAPGTTQFGIPIVSVIGGNGGFNGSSGGFPGGGGGSVVSMVSGNGGSAQVVVTTF